MTKKRTTRCIFVAAAAVTLSSCSTSTGSDPENSKTYKEATFRLGVPSAVEGEIDSVTEYRIMQRDQCGDDIRLCQLYDRSIVDTYVAELLAANAGKRYDEIELPNGEVGEAESLIQEVSGEHTRWLKDQVESHGWFTIEEYGPEADAAAFLLVQHSFDVEFQSLMLPKLIELAKTGDTNSRSIALLSDRIAIKQDQLQEFGTQGKCNSDGIWEPFPVKNPEKLDARRLELNLPTIEAYSTRLTERYCPR